MNKISDIYPLMCKFESNKQIYYSKSEYLTYSLESSAPYVNFPGDQKLSQLKNNPQALSPSLSSSVALNIRTTFALLSQEIHFLS